MWQKSPPPPPFSNGLPGAYYVQWPRMSHRTSLRHKGDLKGQSYGRNETNAGYYVELRWLHQCNTGARSVFKGLHACNTSHVPPSVYSVHATGAALSWCIMRLPIFFFKYVQSWTIRRADCIVCNLFFCYSMCSLPCAEFVLVGSRFRCFSSDRNIIQGGGRMLVESGLELMYSVPILIVQGCTYIY